jgi:hypothetical protein
LRQAANSLMNVGDPSGRDVLNHSLRLLRSHGASVELGLSLLVSAVSHFNSGAIEVVKTTVQEVESMATGDNLELSAQFHMVRGYVRSWTGDPTGLTEMEDSIQLLINADLAQRAAVAYFNLAEVSRLIVGARGHAASARRRARILPGPWLGYGCVLAAQHASQLLGTGRATA